MTPAQEAAQGAVAVLLFVLAGGGAVYCLCAAARWAWKRPMATRRWPKHGGHSHNSFWQGGKEVRL